MIVRLRSSIIILVMRLFGERIKNQKENEKHVGNRHMQMMRQNVFVML